MSQGWFPDLPRIEPPLLNSASPWATTLEDLQKLYTCPSTGSVTTRTCTIDGFNHDPKINQYAYFNPMSLSSSISSQDEVKPTSTEVQNGSLNTLGYSPEPLDSYLHYVKTIDGNLQQLPNKTANSLNGIGIELEPSSKIKKPIIISVTGSATEVALAYTQISKQSLDVSIPLCMEINLSCPNIPGKPPPAYSRAGLTSYLHAIDEAITSCSAAFEPSQDSGKGRIPVGIKLPPYTYSDQFKDIVAALEEAAYRRSETSSECPIAFVTSTNTLGSCLLLDDELKPAIASADGEGIGGLAGTPLHPLSLGNVRTLRRLLDQSPPLRRIKIIGVGGVKDASGFARMKAAGADAVGLATALGREGLDVFEKIRSGDGERREISDFKKK
ncbi:MAG: dihydroorotate dehydrogenase [Bogoriella megaspora]|nr:MAG: dihydroorotate dehydrogenase [Bogoriella megaspora]